MRLNLLGDIDWESKVDQVLASLSDSDYRSYFQERDYGAGLVGVTVVLMCQDPALNLKRRIRLSKKEKKLYMDIMLDLAEMKAAADLATRRRIVFERLLKEVPEVVSKYSISDFDAVRFIDDFRMFFENVE
jgi:hypothetical protein